MGKAVAKVAPVVAGAAIGFAIGGPAGMSYGAALGGAAGSAMRGGDISQIIQGGMYGYSAGSVAGAGATAYNASTAVYGPTTSGMDTAKVFGKALIPSTGGAVTSGVVSAGGQIIPALLKGEGIAKTAEAQKAAGVTANQAENFAADQLITQAGQDRAAGQRGMIEEIRQMKLAQGRAQAVAAAGGGGALDTSVMDIMGDLETQGRYKGDVAMYEGESSARNKETGAALARFSGQQAIQAGNISSVSTLMSGASDLYSKYGGTSYG